MSRSCRLGPYLSSSAMLRMSAICLRRPRMAVLSPWLKRCPTGRAGQAILAASPSSGRAYSRPKRVQ
eukprot:5914347-Alexandrium_andersonii.AAC.1